MGPLLQATGLGVTFGAVAAVSGVDLHVGAGELVGLIGPNGAGKTTTIDALTGFVPHTGRVRLGEVDLTGLPPHERVRAGLGRTWQSLELFDDLSLRENCRAGAQRPSLRSLALDVVRPGRPHDDEAIDWALEVVGLAAWGDRRPGSLSLGQQKLAAVARVLAIRPAVVLLDEPAAGLDTDESRRLGDQLRRIVDHGTAVLLVDHDMGLVLSTCDRIAVLEFGRLIAEGTPAAVRADARVVEAYLGGGATPVEAT